jgi:hypothetical protein
MSTWTAILVDGRYRLHAHAAMAIVVANECGLQAACIEHDAIVIIISIGGTDCADVSAM